MRALALDLVALERLHRDQQVVGAELVLGWPPMTNVTISPRAALPRPAGVEARNRGGDQRHLLAETRPSVR